MDQTRDLNGQQTHRIVGLYGGPDYIQNATIDEQRGTENQPPHVFADPITRSFLCKNAASTWLSAAFFYEGNGNDNDRAKITEERILKSAKYFGIATDVEQLRKQIKKASQTSLQTLPDDDFAVVVRFSDGRRERHYPLRNSLEVKTAAAYLVNYRDDFRFNDRHKIASRILEKAAQYGTALGDLQDFIDCMAGRGICATKDAAAMIRSRIPVVQNERLREQLDLLANSVENHPRSIHTTGEAIKIARVIDQIDKGEGIHYLHSVHRPEDVLFAVTEKRAMAATQSIVGNHLSGRYYQRSDLEKIPVTDLRDAFGDDFVKNITTGNTWIDTVKLAEALPTLLRSDAELFDSIAMENGVTPLATKVVFQEKTAVRQLQQVVRAV